MLGATATGADPTDRGGESHPTQPNTPSPLVHGSVRYIANPPGGGALHQNPRFFVETPRPMGGKGGMGLGLVKKLISGPVEAWI